MRILVAVMLGLGALTALPAETSEQTAGAKAHNQSRSAYLRGDQSQSNETLNSAAEALPSDQLTRDLGVKPGISLTEAESSTETDLVLRREQKDWLTVGVQKLTGDYKPEANLSEEELLELEEKRASIYSPTLFVDHFARLEQAKGNDTPAKPAIELDWGEPLAGQGQSPLMDFTRGWTTSREPIVSVNTQPRQNPYLQQLNLADATTSAMAPATPGMREPVAPVSNSWRQAASSVDRKQPLLNGNSNTAPTAPTALATPANSPQTEPETPKSWRKEDISEKYFRNLDRF
ncbi:hypothetical protein [Cerasicoccus frondis]|uniref:hypothetical protein n=1 Tax=Cerasicoccus frondis TaxID=490090 RepID=UPI0028528850|nr:hypothetical protein [Cerasicoccus frondis]